MTLDQFAALAQIAAVVLSAVAIGLGFYVRSVATDKCEKLKEDYQEKIDGVEKGANARVESVTSALYQRINLLGDRMQHLEGKVEDSARRDDVHALSLQLANMSGDLKAMATKIESLAESAHVSGLAIKRVENHLFKIEG